MAWDNKGDNELVDITSPNYDFVVTGGDGDPASPPTDLGLHWPVGGANLHSARLTVTSGSASTAYDFQAGTGKPQIEMDYHCSASGNRTCAP
jgi:hypothetical protein